MHPARAQDLTKALSMNFLQWLSFPNTRTAQTAPTKDHPNGRNLVMAPSIGRRFDPTQYIAEGEKQEWLGSVARASQ